ncbi:MAG: hypothetical protein KC619_22240 [Myxococcales bacterium]|nr:hypothetical protein [Myxococcales bacterium]
MSASDVDVEPLVKAIQASAERLGCGSEHLELAFSIDESPVPIWVAKRHDVPSSPRANATRVVVRGYGGTPDEAIEDLERRLRSAYPWTVRHPGDES